MGRLLTGPWARGVLDIVREGRVPDGRPTEMQWLRIGPVGWVGTPGETVQEIGHAIEKRYRESASVEDLWPVAYANDEIGYLCTERHHHEGGYEPNAYPYYGEPARYRNEERVILKAAGALLKA